MKKFFACFRSDTLVSLLLLFPPASYAATHVIEVKNYEFVQGFDTVAVGDTVRWVWLEGTHTTTSNGIPAGAMPWNELLTLHHPYFSYVVLVAGRYEFISIPYAPQMGSSFVAVGPSGLMHQQEALIKTTCDSENGAIIVSNACNELMVLRVSGVTGRQTSLQQTLLPHERLSIPVPASGPVLWLIEARTSAGRQVRKLVCP